MTKEEESEKKEEERKEQSKERNYRKIGNKKTKKN